MYFRNTHFTVNYSGLGLASLTATTNNCAKIPCTVYRSSIEIMHDRPACLNSIELRAFANINLWSSLIQGMLVYRSIKAHYCKQMRRKTNALLAMVMCYRRKFVEKWFREVVEKFKDCSTMSPDYGRSLEWPKPPPAMIVS